LNAFTDQHSQLLDSFADQAAIAIENTRLFQELDERARQLVRLQEVTTAITAEPSNLEKVLDLILENLSKIFQGASCAIRLYDSKPDQFKPLKATGVLEGLADRSPRRNGTSRYAVKTKAPRYLEGEALVRPLDGGPAVRQKLVKKGVRAFAYLPLISKGDVIGILYVALVEAYRFSQNDRKILKLFADQAAITIENARLFERIQELRVVELETLSHLGDDLAALEQAF
jgi:two-component system NtrC family sensor kinase